MKKLIVLVSIFLILFSINLTKEIKEVFVEKIDFNFDSDDERAFTFLYTKKIDSILVSSRNNSLLLILNKEANNYNNLISRFNINNLNILTYQDIDNIDIKYNSKIKLNNNYYFDNIKYLLEGNILKIIYGDTNFCIHLNISSSINDVSTCNFIYFDSLNQSSKLKINSNTNIIFYHSSNPLPTHILNDIYKEWIDVYSIKEEEFTILKLVKDDYKVIVVPDT
jgi:hypothetical protein